ncbi:acetylxylan esterase [Streptomyces sp. NPDC050560]|uniref:acetylxylan esterase n=1 Tax=Streptomyces sp. NPDC050560 TaxID=3365630 RepID=UPI0037AD1660
MDADRVAVHGAGQGGGVAIAAAALDYFGGVNLAARATAPALFSAALRDPVCPPGTVIAAHHGWAGPKSLEIWPYGGHEGGGAFQTATALAFVAEELGR